MFARLYHAHHQRYEEDLPFWLDLAGQQGGPVLELGCGSGRVSIPLARAGFAAFGLDRDPDMLALLREILPADLRSSVHIFQGDLTAFRLEAKFPLILLPCNTFSTLTATERGAALACVHRHLPSGGLFAVSMPNPTGLARLPKRGESVVEDVFVHPLSGNPLQVSSSWERDRWIFRLYWHYDHLLSDGSVERLTAESRHHLSPAEVYLEELRAAHLLSVATYGDFDCSAFERTSPSLIMLARRE